MMSYDGSSVTVALMSDLHGVAVAKVPTNATSTTKAPTSAAQSRRTVAAAITAIDTAHPMHVAAETAAAGSVVTTCIGQVQLTSAHSKDLS